MSLTLKNIVDTYLQDEAYYEDRQSNVDLRDQSINTIKPIIEHFIAGSTDLVTFREQIDRSLRDDPEQGLSNWGARGTGFLMELNKLAHNHPVQVTTDKLRSTLAGLNAENLGIRIEDFFNFLTMQRQTLRQNGMSGNMLMNAGNTAFFLSLFAFWLDRIGKPYICYPSLRKNLKMLIDYGLHTSAAGLRITYDKVLVETEQDYVALEKTLDSLLTVAPELKREGLEGYWVESFLYWLDQNLATLLESDATGGDDEVIVVETRMIVDDAPLAATPEPLLSHLIAEIQQQILISEEDIRSIYHALLSGHVILTGPPGTGKTHLATLLPEILWQTEEPTDNNSYERTKATAYTTRVVTATDEWSVRTLIGGLAPKANPSGGISYPIQPGHLTQTVLENWNLDFHTPTAWEEPARARVRGARNQEFRGRWLVIDEFNRAPIDIAFGEALTTLGGSSSLRVPVNNPVGSAELPLPKDFRIIGTLNSFDRNYLNRISEAMKRRFKSIEILPPSRAMRADEQAIVLRKAFERIAHLRDASVLENVRRQTVFESVFNQVWNAFEVIRIYRQLGTAQAISFTQQALIEAVLRDYTTEQAWLNAFDMALCASIADQLQVLLPDELAVIVDYLRGTLTLETYLQRFNTLHERRQSAQSQALQRVDDSLESGADLTEDSIAMLFPVPQPELPKFRKRLHSYSTERGL